VHTKRQATIQTHIKASRVEGARLCLLALSGEFSSDSDRVSWARVWSVPSLAITYWTSTTLHMGAAEDSRAWAVSCQGTREEGKMAEQQKTG